MAALPLVASCFQFCRTDAKTEDHFFMGFPSYWNIVAFYVVVFDLGEVATTAVLLALTVLIFVPIKYVYPSRTETLWYTNMALATAFLVLFGAITSQLPDVPVVLTGLSLAYLAYYVAISLWLTLRTGNPVAPAAVDRDTMITMFAAPLATLAGSCSSAARRAGPTRDADSPPAPAGPAEVSRHLRHGGVSWSCTHLLPVSCTEKAQSWPSASSSAPSPTSTSGPWVTSTTGRRP